MEKIRCGQVVTPAVKKGKKKQVKGELDRIKQAEKKRRRLQKALATSAAIRSELEKKKQKKIEEQQRLDEEGAAIAEAAALHVLREDTDESRRFIINSTDRYKCWDYPGNIDHFLGDPRFIEHSVSGLGGAVEVYDLEWKWNSWETGLPLASQFYANDLQSQLYDGSNRGAETSADILAAQAVSSLQIAEDSH